MYYLLLQQCNENQFHNRIIFLRILNLIPYAPRHSWVVYQQVWTSESGNNYYFKFRQTHNKQLNTIVSDS